MNSMNNVEEIIAAVEANFDLLSSDVIDKYQVGLDVNKNEIHRLLIFLKTNGWIQLSYLTAVDWIEENEFELVYIVFNWDKAVHIQIRTRIERDVEKASIETIMPIYPGCKYYEREVHEFFGIKFPGNPDYHKQLILEQFDDLPPLRKDFDPLAYAERKFPKRDYPDKFTNLEGKESEQAKRDVTHERVSKLRTGGTKK